MSSITTLQERGRALEDEYFRRVDQELIRKREEALEREAQIAELARITGIDDSELFEQLVAEGLDASSIAALTLTPMIFVAWADGTVDAAERQTVISTAMRQGLVDSPHAFDLVEQWLRKRPPRSLWDAWKHYAIDFHHSVPPYVANKLARRTVIRATRVAKATGGVFGMGKISRSEQRVIDEIESTLPERVELNERE